MEEEWGILGDDVAYGLAAILLGLLGFPLFKTLLGFLFATVPVVVRNFEARVVWDASQLDNSPLQYWVLAATRVWLPAAVGFLVAIVIEHSRRSTFAEQTRSTRILSVSSAHSDGCPRSACDRGATGRAGATAARAAQ
eukprot:1210430-Prymnesium_polylepis.1